MNTGIYSITSPSGKQYIGSAVDIVARFAVHKSLLKNKKHHSIHLQSAFNKYQGDGFIFDKILICSKEDLIFYEQRTVEILTPAYNMCPVAGSRLGTKLSPETKAEMSRVRSGVIQTPEHIAKRVAKTKGKQRSSASIAAYIAMRDRSILCVETGQVFRSGKAAGDWCFTAGLTTSRNSQCSINRAISLKKTAYGYHWILLI